MRTRHSRRDFIRLSATGAIGAIVLPQSSCGSKGSSSTKATVKDKKITDIGLQLYSVRDEMTADVPGTLQQVADDGYKYLELADYADRKFYGYTPAEFKKLVDFKGFMYKNIK